MNAHTRPDPLADRYSVRSYGSRDMAMVYDGNRHFAGPCSWEDAQALAAHMEAVHKRSRQQIEAEEAEEHHVERMPRWSVGDWQASAQRRTR